MPRHTVICNSRTFAWVLALLFLHAQSVMGVAMRAGIHGPDEAGVSMHVADGAHSKMVHVMADGQNAGFHGATCPMKPEMQTGSGVGCGGGASCCSAVSELYWPLVTITHDDIFVLPEAKPASCASLPPFHPPDRG